MLFTSFLKQQSLVDLAFYHRRMIQVKFLLRGSKDPVQHLPLGLLEALSCWSPESPAPSYLCRPEPPCGPLPCRNEVFDTGFGDSHRTAVAKASSRSSWAWPLD